MRKRLPKITTDTELEGLLEKDLGEFITHDNFTSVTFEFEAKDKVVNLRMSQGLFEQVRSAATRRKIPYQRFIRQALEKAVKN